MRKQDKRVATVGEAALKAYPCKLNYFAREEV